MSYVVVIRVHLEGVPELFQEVIVQYRSECLRNEPGMEHFLVCRIPDDEQGFLLVEVFTDEKAHRKHAQGKELEDLLKTMEERELKMAAMIMAGEEMSSASPLLN